MSIMQATPIAAPVGGREHYFHTCIILHRLPKALICTIGQFLWCRMVQTTNTKLWRLEANNPTTGTDWRFLWAFDRAEEAAYLELIDDLDLINRPVQLRIVRDTGGDGQ
jgi:hypothetical protein